MHARLGPLLACLLFGCEHPHREPPDVEEEEEEGDMVMELPSACESDESTPSDDPLDTSTCESFGITEEFPQVRVRILNASDDVLIVPEHTSGCQETPRYFVGEGLAGERPLEIPHERCPVGTRTCAGVIDPFDDRAYCLLCQMPLPSIRVPPGQWFESDWESWVWAPTKITSACADVDAPTECKVTIAAPPGAYTLRSKAWKEADYVQEKPYCACEEGTTFAPCEVVDIDDDWRNCGRLPAKTPVVEAEAQWDGVCDTIDFVFR